MAERNTTSGKPWQCICNAEFDTKEEYDHHALRCSKWGDAMEKFLYGGSQGYYYGF